MLGGALCLVAGAVVYGPVLFKLARDWSDDPTYSHGFVVLPIALFLAWERRDRLRASTAAPSAGGLIVVLLSLALMVLGVLGAELFTTRLSLIGVLAGAIVYVRGWPTLRVLAFPLLFLLFMIPIPAIVFDRVSVSLQLVASGFAERILQGLDVPVLRDGNVLTLSNVTLEVNDACSGIRSLSALVCVTVLACDRLRLTPWRSAVLALAAIPVAILLNGIRVATTGIAALHFGPAAASGAVHTMTGWVMFVVALACVGVLMRAVRPEPEPA